MTVKDSFSQCFVGSTPQPWNWNWYLFPAWVLGVLFRYLFLFPLRICLFITGFIIFSIGFLYAKVRQRASRRTCSTSSLLPQTIYACVATPNPPSPASLVTPADAPPGKSSDPPLLHEGKTRAIPHQIHVCDLRGLMVRRRALSWSPTAAYAGAGAGCVRVKS